MAIARRHECCSKYERIAMCAELEAAEHADALLPRRDG